MNHLSNSLMPRQLLLLLLIASYISAQRTPRSRFHRPSNIEQIRVVVDPTGLSSRLSYDLEEDFLEEEEDSEEETMDARERVANDNREYRQEQHRLLMESFVGMEFIPEQDRPIPDDPHNPIKRDIERSKKSFINHKPKLKARMEEHRKRIDRSTRARR